MAFMAMRKNLDERARKKAFDELFERYDHNRNGRFFLIRVIFMENHIS